MLSFLKSKSEQSEKLPEIAKEASEIQEWKETIFDIIKTIKDPEKPETLEDLEVVQEDLIQVDENLDKADHYIAKITFVPTVPHCSLATLIGLCIRTKLEQELPPGKTSINHVFRPKFPKFLNFAGKFKIDLQIKEGSHSTGEDITKQINDKERVAAALENPNLRETVDNCINNQDY